jgi:hypothetical protein
VAQNKYMKLGRPGDFESLPVPGTEIQARSVEIFLGYGIIATVGG